MIKKFFYMYVDGFKHLSTLGKTLWIIIFIKLFIMFFILKLFFFPNVLKRDFKTNEERSKYIIHELTKN
ncbi:MAG: DUF4492 domain-containing protein [Bacteroidales bacterium]|nr:DUF4492 domain-containing protein [Bacteroidales bacterium]